MRNLIRRCLERDVRKRLRDIGEARIALEDVAIAEPAAAARVVTAIPRLLWAALAVLTVLATAVSWVHYREISPSSPVIRTTIPPPEGSSYHVGSALGNSGLAVLSPDGLRLAFSARSADGKVFLWMRSLDALNGQSLAGTEGAAHPFWSPDSRYLGFFADGKLKRIAAAGGPVITLCDAPQPRGGSWSRAGVIVFTPNARGLHRVSAAGGASTPVASPDGSAKSGRFPWFLPDGSHFLYSGDLGNGGGVARAIRVGSLEPGAKLPKEPIVDDNSNAAFSQGHLFYLREDILMAQPFDAGRLATTGEAMPVVEGVVSVGLQRRGGFSVSRMGSWHISPIASEDPRL